MSWGDNPRRAPIAGELKCPTAGCGMMEDHAGECGAASTALATRGATSLHDNRAAAAALLRDVFGGAKRVVVMGDRGTDGYSDGSAPSEPNMQGEDGIQAGVWDPRARAVYGFEPGAGEANEFGEGGSVQGYSETERRAAYRTFLRVRRAFVELAEAKDPEVFVKKLREVAGHLGPDVARQLDATVGRMLALSAPAAADVAPDLRLASGDEDE